MGALIELEEELEGVESRGKGKSKGRGRDRAREYTGAEIDSLVGARDMAREQGQRQRCRGRSLGSVAVAGATN